MLNEISKYTLCTLFLCALWGALSAPLVYANSRCADLVPSSSFKEQSVPVSKEQSAQTDFGFGSEPAPSGKNVLSSSSSSGSTLGSSSSNALESSSSNVFEPSLTSNTLDFYSNFFNFSGSKNPIELTKNFQSYIGELLDKRIIGEPQLIRFIEHLEKGELISLISEDEARVSTPLLVQRRGLQNYLDKASLDQKELLDWSRATLEKRARVRVRREEVQEETWDIYQKLEFHPVKRPVHFEMKNGGGSRGKDKPVTLTYPIEVQSTPVTQNQWVEIMGENPSHFAEGEDSVVLNFHGKGIELQPDNPVENITWWSILEFANRLSKKHDLTPAYDLSGIDWKPGTRPENGTLEPVKEPRRNDNIRVYAKGESHDPYEGDIYYQAEGYRLPTMAEQAYMLQGGRNIKTDSFFKDENEMKEYAWYKDNANDKTHPVGLLRSIVIDGKHFYEIYGNVREWGWDWSHHLFKLQGEQNPLVPKITIDGSPATRGGGWSRNIELVVYPLTRVVAYPEHRESDLGFRLVRTVKPSDGEQGDGD